MRDVTKMTDSAQPDQGGQDREEQGRGCTLDMERNDEQSIRYWNRNRMLSRLCECVSRSWQHSTAQHR